MTTENYCRHCSTTAESMEDLWVNHAACNDAHAASDPVATCDDTCAECDGHSRRMPCPCGEH